MLGKVMLVRLVQ